MITVIIAVCVYSTIVSVFFVFVYDTKICQTDFVDFLWIVIMGPAAWLLSLTAFIIRTIRHELWKHQKRKREKELKEKE